MEERRARLKKVLLDGHECWDEDDCYCEKYSGKKLDTIMKWFEEETKNPSD